MQQRRNKSIQALSLEDLFIAIPEKPHPETQVLLFSFSLARTQRQPGGASKEADEKKDHGYSRLKKEERKK